MNSSENNNRAASHDFQTALGLLEERLRSLEDSEDIINGLLQGAAEFYVTEQFPKLLDANGLRRIRFHDLRHSCASLMLANGVPMKQIQDRLGHSDFSTTANIYAHLDYNTKLSSADAMLSGLGFQTEKA